VGGLGGTTIGVEKRWWCLTEVVTWGSSWCSDEVLDG
jgi:hypothetical protein